MGATLAGGYPERVVEVSEVGDRQVTVQAPECERAAAARRDERSTLDVLGDFWDWLESRGLILGSYGATKERTARCRRCRGTGRDAEAMTPRQRQLLAAGQLDRDDWPVCPACIDGKVYESYIDEASFAPAAVTPARLFADYLGVDLDVMENEKLAILASLRDDPPPDGWTEEPRPEGGVIWKRQEVVGI